MEYLCQYLPIWDVDVEKCFSEIYRKKVEDCKAAA